VTSLLTSDDGLVPTEFVAVTVNVYATPFVNPLTTHAKTLDAVHVKPPGDDVTVYNEITAPPLFDGADQRTVARVSPAVATTFCGADGAVATARGVTVTATDAGLTPILLTALMRILTGTSGVRPVRVAEVDVETPSFQTDQTPELLTLYSTM
jgi:hypothetical protein